MTWLNNITIRTKVIGAFAMVLFVTIALGAFSIQKLSASNHGSDDLANNWLVATGALGDFAAAAQEYRMLQGTMGLATSQEQMQERADRIKNNVIPKLDASLKVYAATVDTPKERDMYETFKAMWDGYAAQHARYEELVNKDYKAATVMLLGPLSKQFDAMQAKLVELQDFQAIQAKGTADHISAAYHTAWYLIMGLIAFAALICVFAGFMTVTGVSGPVRRMTTAMGRLAEHDLSVVIEGQERKDEIGQMAAAVQVFKNNMIEGDRLKEEQEVSQKRRAARTARMDELTRSFEESVSSIVHGVSSQAEQMENSAESMTATAEETTKQASAVAAASEQSAANVQTVASATEELSSSISEISRQVGHSSQITSNAVSEANKAGQMVQGLVSASQKIGEIVALINDIADQTNLLALNATIEAARAGEAGKGFAVVAAEVKNLASQTSKATEEIGAQITGVQNATQDAVKAIDAISRTIGEVDSIATTIAAAVEEQGAATREIARNVEEAAKGTQEVSSNIGGVTEAANGTGAVATQVLKAAQSLTGQSTSLRDLVNKFLSDVKAA